MDSALNDFFNGKSCEGKRVPTGVAHGRIVTELESDDDIEYEEPMDAAAPFYPYSYEKIEMENFEFHHQRVKEGTMSNVDSLCDIFGKNGMAEVRENMEEHSKKVYSTYTFNTKLNREKLAIHSFKKDILNYVNSTSVLIIRGQTGCGKTTQVPQFFLDDAREKNTYCNIIVTQPRRIAAVSVARRVCDERCWTLGSVCGYQVGLENMTSPDTILNYVTTGVLLQKLIHKQNLNDYTHIIIDEVHERTQEMDFVLLLARRFLRTNSLSVKLILMSATFDTNKFAYYLRTHAMDIDVPAPTVYISKENKHKSLLFYLDQISAVNRPIFDINEPEIKESMLHCMVNLIKVFETLDVVDPSTNTKTIGNVLVFLPGYFEIETAYNVLVEQKQKAEKLMMTTEPVEKPKMADWLILPLHSMNTSVEQQRVFIPAGPNQRKIILSTNLAESSLTLVDIVYVIDFCLTKVMVVDPVTRYQSLKLQWASKVNCNQRAGRVGRVGDGRVYRLVPQSFYENELSKDISPEMLTAPLERVVLGSKLLKIQQPPKSILALAIDPPKLDTIEATILNLKETGALLLTSNERYTKSDGDLTFLGQVMCSLPLDIKMSKLIVLGYIFSCMDDCIIMAAGCSLPNIFKTPFQERLQSYNNRLTWADGSSSDLIAYLNLYKVWEKNKSTGAFLQAKEREWCRKYFLSNKALREWSKLVEDLRLRLDRLGIKNIGGPGKVTLSHNQGPLYLKIAICGAFYPNYFKRVDNCGQILEKTALREVNGLDPMQTVYYTNMEYEQPGPLYAKTIRNALMRCGTNLETRFNGSKIYVTFKEPPALQTITLDGEKFLTKMPGKISTGVYRAVRMRQLQIKTAMHTLKKEEAWKLATLKGIAMKNSMGRFELINKSVEIKSNVLPSLSDITLPIRISHVIDAGHFFAQPIFDDVDRNISTIDDYLNFRSLTKKITSIPKIGDWCAALFEEDEQFYRVEVLAMAPGAQKRINVQISFIDFGNVKEVPYTSLYELPKGDVRTIPPQAVECILSNVKPSAILNGNGLWSQKANETLKLRSVDQIFTTKVFSAVNKVVSLELYTPGHEMSFNDWLIEEGYAQRAEESLLSKQDNAKRLEAQALNSAIVHSSEVNFMDIYKEVEAPTPQECHRKFDLKGPFSPLEMTVTSMTDTGKTVVIDGNSVNTVLLDADPQDNHERLLVASCIAQSATIANRLSLRDTTMMPNIHGLPMLLALLFCPRMVPKPTEDGVFIAALLCGLGEHADINKAIYPDHDFVVYLDTELTEEDMTEVNEFRYWLNKTIECMEVSAEKNNPPISIEVCQRQIHERVSKLLHKTRTHQDIQYIKHAEKWHKFEYEGERLYPGNTNMKNEIWPLHWTIQLKAEHKQHVFMKKHLETLTDMAMRVKPLQEIKCLLCNVDIHSISDMRLHLSSASHMVAEKKFKD